MSKQNNPNDEEEEVETLSGFIYRTVDDVFINNIPMEAIKDLPKAYMYLLGAIAELGTLALFTYFVYQGYQSGINAKYISLDITSGVCTSVIKSVSGAYIADASGNWAGSSDFLYSRGIYDLNLVDASITETQYNEIMALAFQQTNGLGNLSKTLDLAMNLLIYVSWQLYCDPNTYSYCAAYAGQTFAFTADASYVFAQSHVATTLSNINGDCTSYSTSSYDLANSINEGSYVYASFITNPTCNTTASPIMLGYDSYLDGDSFYMDMDVRSVMDSVAINFLMLALTGIEVIQDTSEYTFYHNGYTYYGQFYIDTWYGGMHPLFCIENSLAQGNFDTFSSHSAGVYPGGVLQLCFIDVGNQTGLPIYMHYGAGGFNYNSPIPCSW